MFKVLIASDSPSIQSEVLSVLGAKDYEVRTVSDGPALLAEAKIEAPDLAVLDFQMGNMGGMATCLDLRLEHSGGRLPEVPVLLLLDRRADVFLARRAGAQGWIIKPLDPIRLRKAVKTMLGGSPYEDSSHQPTTRVLTEG